jgi:hypothetical protein
MRNTKLFMICLIALSSCGEKNNSSQASEKHPLAGTWRLVSSKIIRQADTVSTFPVPNQEMIKMFTDREFAFFNHNINLAKGDSSIFTSGSGTYELHGEDYTEHLSYCNYREWENHDFHFKLIQRNDTLIQTGVEKIDSLNIDQKIIEIYVRK